MHSISSWIFLLSSCTWFHHFHRYSKDSPKLQPHNLTSLKSCKASPTSFQCVDQIVPPTLDNCLSQSHPKHKCNCPTQQLGNIVSWCSLPGNLSKRQLTGHIARQTTNSLRHHNHHKRRATRQMHKFRGNFFLFPSAWFVATRLSKGWSTRLRPNRSPRHTLRQPTRAFSNLQRPLLSDVKSSALLLPSCSFSGCKPHTHCVWQTSFHHLQRTYKKESFKIHFRKYQDSFLVQQALTT